MKKKKINLIVFCMAVVCAVSFCLAIFLSFPRGEKTAVAESRNITVIDARQAEEMLQFEDTAKTILVGTVSDDRRRPASRNPQKRCNHKTGRGSYRRLYAFRPPHRQHFL